MDTALSLPIDKLRNVGPRNIPRLKKLGIKTVKDLLWHFPARYEDYREIISIADVEPGEKVNIQGQIIKITNRQIFPRRMTITKAIVKDDTGAINAVWFNQPYIANNLREGTIVSLAGKAGTGKHGLHLSSPTYEKLKLTSFPHDDASPDFFIPAINNLTHTAGLIPVYHETEGVTSKYLRFLIKPLLKNLKLNDPLPQEIKERNNFPPLGEAVKSIHYPKNQEEADQAKERLAFDDLFIFQIKALLERRKLNQFRAAPIEFSQEMIKKFLSGLPFELTNDQKVAAWEILKDLQKTYPMNRLLEGDVGSGKTVVALIAAYQAAKRGFQSVFMAPTEVLAQQHFKTISKLVKNSGLKIALLTSSMAKIDGEAMTKKDLKKEISEGGIDILIGTHAVIQKDVNFHKLALVIIDEQHRFGVSQRAKLVRGSIPIKEQINTDSKLLYEDLTYKIRGVIFKVFNTLGPGHKEIIYHKALIEELKICKIKFTTEEIIPIKYGDKKVGDYKPDLVIEKKIIMEIKALQFLGKTELRQIWYYLKGSKFKVALLVNFGFKNLEIKRFIYNPQKSVLNPYESDQQMRIPHLLSMTATPIPRTLALTIYGDLDISLIKEKPKNRKKIITKVIPPHERQNAYDFIREEIKGGRQVFVICPRIEIENAGNAALRQIRQTHCKQAQGKSSSQMKMIWAEVKAVEEEFKKLSREIFPDLKVAMLHGKMKPKEKNKIMGDFKNRDYDILVSTSVIEVGVDVPNASVMMIESAERFGLAQLHQFRGRVGRAEHQSHCLLFTSTGDKLTNKRLKALIETDDGFILAEKDMLIRGPGEFFGVKQSGLPDLAMAALANVELIKKARLEARLLLKQDSSLKNYPLLKEKLESFQRLTHFE